MLQIRRPSAAAAHGALRECVITQALQQLQALSLLSLSDEADEDCSNYTAWAHKLGLPAVPGVGPTYSFIYPNVMINRYSVWMDTLHVIPTSHNTCICHIDYWVPPSKVCLVWARGGALRGDMSTSTRSRMACKLRSSAAAVQR